MLSASFLDFIKHERLFEKGEHLLLAISGGLDSVVLAHLLKDNNFNFTLAHMNFQLRGSDSNEDELFVKQLADQLGVEVKVKKVEIDKKSGSTQIQARELRYKWFEELLEKHSFSKLLTAHHANDLLETALHNLTRGTGIKGLRSILPLQNQIARPLLFASKNDLEQYATINLIQWREDSSNSSDHYTRNKIRHHVVPILMSLNPSLITGFQQTALRLRATEAAWQEKLSDVSTKYLKGDNQRIEIDKALLSESHALVYLSEILSEYEFGLAQLQSFDFSRVGAQLFSKAYVLTVDREHLLINKAHSADLFSFFPQSIDTIEESISTPFGKLDLEIITRGELNFEDNSNIAFIDYDSLQEGIIIDCWHEGDQIQPLGMKGKKKISDILIDQKVSLPEKQRTMVLKSADKIIWVIGYKFSELFKVKEDTKKILRIEYYENS